MRSQQQRWWRLPKIPHPVAAMVADSPSCCREAQAGVKQNPSIAKGSLTCSSVLVFSYSQQSAAQNKCERSEIPSYTRLPIHEPPVVQQHGHTLYYCTQNRHTYTCSVIARAHVCSDRTRYTPETAERKLRHDTSNEDRFRSSCSGPFKAPSGLAIGQVCTSECTSTFFSRLLARTVYLPCRVHV